MPRPPLPVSADQAADVAVVMTPFKLDIAADWLALPEEPVMAEDSEAEPLEDGGMVVASDDTWDFDLEHAASDEDQPEAEDAPGHEPVSDEALQAFLDEPLHDYDFRHAVLLQQSRRMRSGELHYIDHPLIGIVVKISRHEFEPFVQTGDDSLASAR